MMSKEVLFVATVDEHILAFHIPYLKYLSENGVKVYVATACSEKSNQIPYITEKFDISISRGYSPKNNYKAIKQLKKIIKEHNFSFIHAHTAIGGLVARIAAKGFRKNGLKVIYTAHHYHFYEGGSRLRFLIHYNIEKYLSKFTDYLININCYDFNISKNNFKAKETLLIRGMGYKDDVFNLKNKLDKNIEREKIGISKEATIFCFIGELSERKNQKFLIDVVNEIKKKNTNKQFVLLLVGKGEKLESLKEQIKMFDLGNEVKLLGFVPEVLPYLSMCDIYLSASIFSEFFLITLGQRTISPMLIILFILKSFCSSMIFCIFLY